MTDLPTSEIRARRRFPVELALFAAQTAAVVLVGVFVSGMFSDGALLGKFVLSRVGSITPREMFSTAFAFLVVLGVLAMVRASSGPSSALRTVMSELILEVPRAIYFVGANLIGVAVLAWIYGLGHPKEALEVLLLVELTLTGITMFAYGFVARSYLSRNRLG